MQKNRSKILPLVVSMLSLLLSAGCVHFHRDHGHSPPGLMKKDGNMPPGQMKKMGQLPPGQAKKL